MTISLDSQDGSGGYFGDEYGAGAGAGGAEGASPATVEMAGGGDATDFLNEPPSVDPSGVLPTRNELLGAVSPDTLAAGVRGMLSGTSGNGRGTGTSGSGTGSGGSGTGTGLKGGRARTSVFGAQGEGFKFIYVFDRSGSMGGSGRSALAAAKAELKASLENLEETHQFQIIFYNERPTIFPLAGQAGRLVFGTAQNKSRAEEFIDRITADGATRHEEALLAALKLGGDVIFFLTDADQPELSPRQLEEIERRNNGRAVINTIEFGLGPQLDRDNFLAKLARQNGGQHVYFDVSKLAPSR